MLLLVTPAGPKIFNLTDIIQLFQDGGVQFPQPGTQGDNIWNSNTLKDSTMVREKVLNNFKRQDGGNPHIWTINEIDTRKDRAIWMHPGITRGGGM